MRALLDANLFISYLLSRRRAVSAIGALLQAAAVGAFTLLFTPGIADEIRRTVAERPDLAAASKQTRLLTSLTRSISLPKWCHQCSDRSRP